MIATLAHVSNCLNHLVKFVLSTALSYCFGKLISSKEGHSSGCKCESEVKNYSSTQGGIGKFLRLRTQLSVPVD